MSPDDSLTVAPAAEQPPESTPAPQKPRRLRAALYVDGFNMYHALDDLKQPFLKWLNLAALAKLFVVGKPEDVVRVVFCTAIRTDQHYRMLRHRAYVRALEGQGVIVLRGHFSEEPRKCKSCGATWMHPTEKEGDTSLSITVVDDAHRDRFDVAYLLTADGDQAPVARMIRADFPEKRLITVAPPRRSHNHKIFAEAHGKISVTEDQIEACLFDKMALDAQGNAVVRPTEYDPPPGWVHPRNRPGKKKASPAQTSAPAPTGKAGP